MQSHPSYRPNNHIATTTVVVNPSGAITKTYQDLATLSDEDILTLTNLILEKQPHRGDLPGADWRYLKVKSHGFTYISFASTTSFKVKMQNVLLVSVVLASGSMIVFFFISLFMAKTSIRPVKRAWQQQQQFIADASHELKTPLTVILANNNILLSHPDDTLGHQEKWLRSTQAEADHMKDLLDNMLSLAKSDGSKNALPRETVHLSDICTDCALRFEPIAFENQIALEAAVEEDITIQGNATQIKQLVHILLDNACKYSQQGDRVHAVLRRSGNIVHMSVNNSGAPIDAADLPHIFERFYRSDKVRTQKNGEGGYGLGLAIAKNIVEQNKGKISVNSSPKEGTTFTVIFKIKNES